MPRPKSAGRSNAASRPTSHNPTDGGAAPVDAELLGRKVTLRYRLRDDATHRFSEAIGVVRSVGDDGILVVVGRRGQVHSIPVADIIALKTL